MASIRFAHLGSVILVGLVGSALGGCHNARNGDLTTGSISPSSKVVAAPTLRDKECLKRAMYFESRRTDEEGLFAVGTVVMNRLASPKYPGTICEVVGQHRQFAPGVLTKPIRPQDHALLDSVADALLAGDRHDDVGRALHFHTAGLTFPYNNMRYVALAGGNTFYEKTDRQGNRPPEIVPAAVATGSGLVPLMIAAAPVIQQSISQTIYASAPTLSPGMQTRFTSAPVSNFNEFRTNAAPAKQ